MDEQDKQHIRAEEIYREEVRAQLVATKPRTEDLSTWKLFNSPIVIVVLSTVVFGILTGMVELPGRLIKEADSAFALTERTLDFKRELELRLLRLKWRFTAAEDLQSIVAAARTATLSEASFVQHEFKTCGLFVLARDLRRAADEPLFLDLSDAAIEVIGAVQTFAAGMLWLVDIEGHWERDNSFVEYLGIDGCYQELNAGVGAPAAENADVSALRLALVKRVGQLHRRVVEMEVEIKPFN